MPSSIHLHYANCLAARVGSEHGIAEDALRAAAPTLARHTQTLAYLRATGETRWRDLPFDPMRESHLREVRRVAKETSDYFAAHAKGKRVKHLVVLGIGGSALGNIALQNALKPWVHNLTPCEHREGARLYVLDNVDPVFVGDLMRHLELKDPGLQHTLVNVISKSGETAETAAQFMIFREWLRKHHGPNYKRHVVAITDPKRGTMRSIVDADGYATLPVPDGVGGRFSVLSPVGLFSAAMAGIDIEALLEGAASIDAACADERLERNPAATLAWLLTTFATTKGKPNHALMPYANALYSLADWYRQLWAESLGKRHDLQGKEVFAGATPIKALGTTDQHSQVQLYREGPNDKVIGFVEVERFAADVPIPQGLNVEALKYLHGKTLGDLIHAEKKATEYALVESQRPNFTITLPEIDAYHVGQFIQLWQVTTAYAGLLLNINAYDQPAVETGKVATFGLMGRAGYGEWREKVERTLTETRHVV